MDAGHHEALARCLAWAVLEDGEAWLGGPSPTRLDTLLWGAATRVSLAKCELPSWRIFGPLQDPAFCVPIVARTGHPTLEIKWARALEAIHFSLTEAMRDLRSSVLAWVERHGPGPQDELGEVDLGDVDSLMARLAGRPGMYLGSNDSWDLRCFLTGMDRGGDWLGVPVLPRLKEIIKSIEDRSREAYGSPFAAYRFYREDPAHLLAWAGIKPATHPSPIRFV